MYLEAFSAAITVEVIVLLCIVDIDLHHRHTHVTMLVELFHVFVNVVRCLKLQTVAWTCETPFEKLRVGFSSK